MKNFFFRFSTSLVFLSQFVSCGVTPQKEVTSSVKIVNGTRVQYEDTTPERMGTVYLGHCTATAIAKDLLLTAAHCVKPSMDEDWYRVQFILPGGGAEYIKVERAIAHPGYASIKLPIRDIALIKLQSHIPSTHRVIPLLFNQSEAGKGKKAVQAGYGMTTDGNGVETDGPAGDILRRADTFITDHRINHIGGVIETKNGDTINGGTAACSGDSGGPLYVQASNGKWYVAGATATTEGDVGRCEGGNTYVSVAAYQQWIINTAMQLTGRPADKVFDSGGLSYNEEVDRVTSSSPQWKRTSGGKITGAPVVAGWEKNGDLYVCRFEHKGGVYLGKLIAGDACRIAYGGKEVKNTEYDVLQNTMNYELAPFVGHIPPNAVAGGLEPNDKKQFVCSAEMENGTKQPGKLIENTSHCRVGYGGKEMKFENFRVLVTY